MVMVTPAKLGRLFGAIARSALPLLAASLIASCATVKVKTDHDATVDFNRYRTFQMESGKVVRGGLGETANTLIEDRIARAIISNLGQRGLAPSRSGADLGVRFIAGTQLMEQVQRTPAPGYGANYSWPAYPPYGDLWVASYQRETLIIDIVDRATDRVVWHSVAVAEGQDFSKPDTVWKAVAKALASYPPRA
jgi:hypothetical protein